MKNLFYLVFVFFYYIYRLWPLKKYKVLFIKTHDKGLDGNIGYIYKALQEKASKNKDLSFDFHFISREDYRINLSLKGLANILRFFIVKPFHLATASYIFLDNVFLPSAFISFRREVKVVQLWHGTGTIKKFGQDVNTGLLGLLEKRANNTYTHLVVNGKATAELYASSFNIPKERIVTLGSPRTDFFFDKDLTTKMKEEFFQKHPEFKDKKIILYAPTFRDHEVNNPKVPLDFEYLQDSLGEDYVFLLRLHPHVAANFNFPATGQGFLYDFSSFPDLNTLLLVTDYLITDYSSIVFEYALLKKPMLFYPYDLEEYENRIRGFYYDYKTFVPGPLAYDTKELVKAIKSRSFNYEKLDAFTKHHYDHFDGASTDRVINKIFGELSK